MTSTPTRYVDVVITTKGLQDRNINILDGTTVENKGKLILKVFIHFIYKIKMIVFCVCIYIHPSVGSCHHGMARPLGCGWGSRPPDMEVSCEYIE